MVSEFGIVPIGIVHKNGDQWQDLVVCKIGDLYIVSYSRYGGTWPSGDAVYSIPAQYAPTANVSSFDSQYTGSGSNRFSQCILDSNGVITIYSNDGERTTGNFLFIYTK